MGTLGAPFPPGAWASGNILIVSHEAILPPFCVKCGRPAEPNLFPKKFSWHPQWVYIFILFAILIYAIVATVISKKMKLKVPLCAKHMEKYKTLRLAAAALLLGCIPEMIFAAVYLPEAYMGWGIAAGFAALLAGWICSIVFRTLLRPTRIDEYYGYFANAGPDFLRLLPPTPPGMMHPR